MNLADIFKNEALISGLTAWLLAQILKVPFEFFRSRKLNWAMLLAAGGMPSSHSSLMVGATMAIGLHEGFDSSMFALGVAITMIVIYDAAGVRRQAGMHAERINVLFEELLRGHIWSEEELREVLGHTPLEVTGGVLLGILVAILLWMHVL